MCSARLVAVAAVLLAPLFLTSCATRRLILRGSHPATAVPLNATKAELIERVSSFYDSIHSFNTTVNLTPSVGSVYKGKITDYKDVTAYIEFRKPEDIRIVGLLPVVRSTAFSMVSNGKEFKVYLPLKNRFIEGENDAPPISVNKAENIRPNTFLSAMLVKPVDTTHELTVKLDDTTEQYSDYQLIVVDRVGDDIRIHRVITFDRVNLQIIEQREYDTEGTIVSFTKYGDWKIYSGIRFPSRIEITRPKDEYGVILAVVKMAINEPISDARFELKRPEGTELQVIGEPPKAAK